MGASAGGLKAFEQFFLKMPPETGMGFVLVPHLDPYHASLLPELLKRYTKMPVVQAQARMQVEPNRLHVIPPNTEMAVHGGALRLTKLKEPRGLRLPVDSFFRSLAADQKERAICIVLSGNGTDGTLGLKAVKAEGGMSMAQEPASAEYDGMPRSAIHTGLVDYVLPPQEMPAQLVQYIKHPYLKTARKVTGLERAAEALEKVFLLLRSRTGHDFSSYKKSTICRRIQRRLSVHRIGEISHYLRFVQQNPNELDALFKDLLIGVTSFFRDSRDFDVLGKKLTEETLALQPKDYTLRVWVPGCASGEEVYSIAILLRECFAKLKHDFNVQLFGTDIDAEAIGTARLGIYPTSIAADVTPERLVSFFINENDNYRVKKEIREMAVFAVQDAIKDPPFTKLDLISCRNLLIYLDSDLQKKLLPVFHYALKPGGMLLLGSSETVGVFSDLFSSIDRKAKLFKRKESGSSEDAMFEFPARHQKVDVGALTAPDQKAGDTGNLAFRQAERVLLDSYVPPSVVVSQSGEILYAHGRTGAYLELPEGQARLNLLEMARGGFRDELSSLLRRVKIQKKRISLRNLIVNANGHFQEFNVTAQPVSGTGRGGELILIVFEDVAGFHNVVPGRTKRKTKGFAPPGVGKRSVQLEQELKITRDRLQSTIEELRTANEEYKSANEELQSTNEELQSTNEELETSKEEVQSINEELVTVNAELQNKIDELSEVNNDINNLFNSIRIATIYLDRRLRIKRFTPEATKVMKLIPADVGRPVTEIACLLENENLAQEAQGVLDSLSSQEKEVKSRDGRWYVSRVIPYRVDENQIDGVVITFTDITDRKRMEIAMEEDARRYAEGIVETLHEPFVVLDDKMNVMSANPSFYRTFRVTQRETQGIALFELGNCQWDIPALHELLSKVLPENTRFDKFEVEHDFPIIGHRKMLLNARQIRRSGVGAEMILLAFRDITAEQDRESGAL